MGIVTALGLIIQLIDVFNTTLTKYQEIINRAKEEGRDLTDEEMEELQKARQKAVADFLSD